MRNQVVASYYIASLNGHQVPVTVTMGNDVDSAMPLFGKVNKHHLGYKIVPSDAKEHYIIVKAVNHHKLKVIRKEGEAHLEHITQEEFIKWVDKHRLEDTACAVQ